MVKHQRPKLSLLCLASTLALSIGAVEAYAQCAPDPDPDPEPTPTARDNQSYDDGRCEHQAGLIGGQNNYCGIRKSAYAAPKEYTFAQLWSGIRTVFGGPDATPLQSEPTIMLAKWSPADEAPEKPPATRQTPVEAKAAPSSKGGEGIYYVQLAAMSSEHAARQYWADLPTALLAKTHGLKARFDPLMTVPSKRSLYAVQTGPFDGEDVARSWCSDLLRAEIDCVIVPPDKS